MASVKVSHGAYTLPDCTFKPPEGKEFGAWGLGDPWSTVNITGNTTVKVIWKDRIFIVTASSAAGGERVTVTGGGGGERSLSSLLLRLAIRRTGSQPRPA